MPFDPELPYAVHSSNHKFQRALGPKSLVIFAVLICMVQSSFAGGRPPDEESIGAVAYSIMFDSNLRADEIESIIRLCEKENGNFARKLPGHGESIGLLDVREFAVPLERMQETILALQKERIFRTSTRLYRRSISLEQARTFFRKSAGKIRFKSYREVNSKFNSQFAYSTQSQWVKSRNWILEKETMLPGAKQIRGAGGHIENMDYFSIIAATKGRTLRITASWLNAGCKLPIVGRVKVKHENMIKSVNVQNRDIQKYFERQAAG